MLIPGNLSVLSTFCAAEASRNPKYKPLTGVHLSLSDGAYEAVASDGARLIIAKGKACEPIDSGSTFSRIGRRNGCGVGTIPAEAWSSAFAGLEDAMPQDDGEIAVQVTKKYAALTVDSGNGVLQQAIAPVIDGKYPEYGEFIPTDPPTLTALVDPHLMIACMEALIATRGYDNPVRIEFRETGKYCNNGIVMRHESVRGGREVTVVLMPCKGDEPDDS